MRFTCQYADEMDKADNVRAEANLRVPLVGEISFRQARSEILKMSTIEVQTYSLPTLVAQKIKAFYERERGKDLYDIYCGLRASDDDMGVIEILGEILIAEGIDFGRLSE